VFDINAPEFVVLIVIAIVLFGPEKLPEFARKAARVIRYLRNVASNAQDQLSKELGPGFEDLDLRDLNPKAFVQKHLLEDVQPIVADVKTELGDLRVVGQDAARDVSGAIEAAKDSPGNGSTHSTPVRPAFLRDTTPYDPDAT
jgi:sec-independent protein translocase protein TatB